MSRETSPGRIRITFETLLPRETITVNILLSKPERPTIDLRSEASLAEERVVTVSTDKVRRSEQLNSVAEILVPLGAVLSAVLWAGAVLALRSRGLFDSYKDRNNSGFLLLHHGLVEQAERVFGDALREGRSDQCVLANYALCKALIGDFEQAEKLLRAAKFRERMGHGRVVVLFNEALIRLTQGDEAEALSKLTEAIKLSPRSIQSYARKSIHLDVVREKAAFREAIGEH